MRNFKINTKNLFLLLIIILLTISCRAQQTYSLSTYTIDQLNNDNYIKDTNGILDKFEGTWRYENGNTIFTVVFTRADHWNPNDLNGCYIDKIIGNYKLEVNNITTTNTIGNLSNDAYTNQFPNIISGINKSDFNELSFAMSDIEKNNKSCQGIFKIIDLNTSPIQATWRIHGSEYMITDGSAPPPQDFSVPINIVLTKI
jgi:hypothetical protein